MMKSTKEKKRLMQKIRQEINLNEIKDAIWQLSETKEFVPFFIDRLKKTNNIAVRNALAISLSGLKVAKAAPIIVDLINKNIENNGGLIYAMQNFDCKDYVVDFVKIICSNNYEARELSFQILEDIKQQIDPQKKENAILILNDYKNNPNTNFDDEGIEYIKGAIKLLKKL